MTQRIKAVVHLRVNADDITREEAKRLIETKYRDGWLSTAIGAGLIEVDRLSVDAAAPADPCPNCGNALDEDLGCPCLLEQRLGLEI